MNLTKHEFIFTDAPFAQCHASTILRTGGGDKLCAWFGGEKEGANDVRIWFSRQIGGIWSAPEAIPAVADLPHWNPVLFETKNGEITLFYKVGALIPQWKTYFTVTQDGGKTWEEPKELIPGDTRDGRGPVKNKPLRHSSGVLLAPASTERGAWRCFIDRFDDSGWEKRPVPVPADKESSLHMIQPTLWEDGNSTVHALMRTRNGYVYRSDSTDGGLTWREAYPTEVFNNNSGIDCAKTDDGRIVLVCNPVQRGRTPLSVLVSSDNGATFEKILDLETAEGEYSYPAVVSDGNKLCITYTYNRKAIAYAEVEV